MLRRDTRAQSIGIARLFLTLGVGAIVFYIVDIVTTPLFDRAGAASAGTAAANGTEWLRLSVESIPLFVLIIAFFGMIAYAVFSREAVR